MARPSKYDTIINKTSLQLIKYWVIKGATEKNVADRLGIHIDTLIEWKKDDRKREFSEALKAERDSADDMVESSLFKKALAGDTTACIFWLKNRRPKEWREKREEVDNTDMTIAINEIKNIIAKRFDK